MVAVYMNYDHCINILWSFYTYKLRIDTCVMVIVCLYNGHCMPVYGKLLQGNWGFFSNKGKLSR